VTCAIDGNIEIEFIKTGLTIEAYEVSTRSSSFKFSHAEAEISREDGERIDNEVVEYDPINLKIGGTIQDRYVFHPEAITLSRGSADLVLHDTEKILQRGTINKNFQNTTVRDVIDYLLERRQDPNGAITGVEHPEDSVQNLPIEDQGKMGRTGILGKVAGTITNIDHSVGMKTHYEPVDTSVNLTDGTPHEGIQKVTNSLALQTWVDSDGVFKYGLQGSEREHVVIDETDEGARLKEYNVTVGSGNISRVIIRGPYTITDDILIRAVLPENTYVYGQAWFEDDSGNEIEGSTFEPNEIAKAHTLKGIRQAARRTLINHYMARREGNIVLNSGSTVNSEPLANLAVGDLVTASATINDHCAQTVETGIFKISKVQHRLDQRRGWITTLSVSGLPAEEVLTKAYKHNTELDKTWDEVDAGESVPDKFEEPPGEGNLEELYDNGIERAGEVYTGLKETADDLIDEQRANIVGDYNEIMVNGQAVADDLAKTADDITDTVTGGLDETKDSISDAWDEATDGDGELW